MHTDVVIDYTNYKGNRRIRKILPIGIYWASTDYHPEEQWLLNAYDVEDIDSDGHYVVKWFAMCSIHSWDSVRSPVLE